LHQAAGSQGSVS